MASREAVPDVAEDNAFFPSPYSLTQYVSAKTDYESVTYPNAYKGDKSKKRVLMIASDERYILLRNGKMFSTGNHPVEMLVPVMHLNNAGFEVDIATLSGNSVKLEIWALPKDDEAVLQAHDKYRSQLKEPLKLSEVIENRLGPNSPYVAVFVPGGHALMTAIPFSREVKAVLKWAMTQNKHIITLCHGPACLVAAGIDEKPEDYVFKGYSTCLFPDSLDEGMNIDIGYTPGKLKWLVGERLAQLGVTVVNGDVTGRCHADRKLLTGDSPMASNALGKMAATALLKELEC